MDARDHHGGTEINLTFGGRRRSGRSPAPVDTAGAAPPPGRWRTTSPTRRRCSDANWVRSARRWLARATSGFAVTTHRPRRSRLGSLGLASRLGRRLLVPDGLVGLLERHLLLDRPAVQVVPDVHDLVAGRAQ